MRRVRKVEKGVKGRICGKGGINVKGVTDERGEKGVIGGRNEKVQTNRKEEFFF